MSCHGVSEYVHYRSTAFVARWGCIVRSKKEIAGTRAHDNAMPTDESCVCLSMLDQCMHQKGSMFEIDSDQLAGSE